MSTNGRGSTSRLKLDFLPSRDLPPLRRAAATISSQGDNAGEKIRAGLEALEKALGLGREEEVRLMIDEQSTQSRDEEDDSTAHDLEHRFAHSWLTRIVSGEVPGLEDEDQDRAARALAALCGRPASEAQITAFLFCTADAIVARTRIGDVPITADALGNRTWGAAPLLARRLVGRYVREGERAQRVLELGAGTGLVGLALAALRNTHVDLTDHHPHVLANLEANVKLNDLSEVAGVYRLDWQAVHGAQPHYTSTAQTLPADVPTSAPYLSPLPAGERYDTIIAADCIYDVHHPVWIRSVAQRYLTQNGVLHLITPLRETHKAEVEAIYGAFPREGEGLCITWEGDEVGYDDFGPRSLGGGQRGLRTTYRSFEIRWQGDVHT
ncbi:hypothetical protein BDZ90DRAFT_233115 [Jaminaea rosea]|uniref:S-adenosyl-L-methionine-dependent methyltransferase n=1 Tax=Jaminaea rosea TaxID=1569628 RepID=A0A316UMK0_9BASI|nr:hypothetical protein BDZ90DRAFT_233115 [Jaminaea rosea]PWN26479.1 hypothetical protein BDZ90DRAFT_233115 [Jaminaea rosea]